MIQDSLCLHAFHFVFDSTFRIPSEVYISEELVLFLQKLVVAQAHVHIQVKFVPLCQRPCIEVACRTVSFALDVRICDTHNVFYVIV